MVTFTDKFDRVDSTGLGSIVTYGWTVVHSGVYGVEIRDKAVTNEAATKSACFQGLLGKYPTKPSQMIRGNLAITAEGADSRVTIGTFSTGTIGSSSDAAFYWGFGATILFGVGGVRTLGIYKHTYGVLFGLAQQTIVATKDVATKTLKNDAGTTDLSVIQELRVIINEEVYGLRIRAYLNNDDDFAPDLEWKEQRDYAIISANNYYSWVFGFGSAALRTLYLLSFEAQDLDFKKIDTLRRDRLTLAQIVERARLRYEGSSRETDFDLALSKQFANDAQDDIINRLGDLAEFIRTRETISVTIDGNGYFTMPNYAERVLRLSTPDGKNVSWKQIGYTTEGSLLMAAGDIQTGYAASSGDYVMDYETRWERMDSDTDVCVIPRRFQEVLVLGVCYRMAQFDTSISPETLFLHKKEYEEKLLNVKRIMNDLRRTQHPRLMSPKPVNSNNFFNDIEWNRTV